MWHNICESWDTIKPYIGCTLSGHRPPPSQLSHPCHLLTPFWPSVYVDHSSPEYPQGFLTPCPRFLLRIFPWPLYKTSLTFTTSQFSFLRDTDHYLTYHTSTYLVSILWQVTLTARKGVKDFVLLATAFLLPRTVPGTQSIH